jgi:hypothetical protein
MREGFGAAFDHSRIEQYTTILRSTPIPSQWIEDVPGDRKQYTVSVNIPNLGVNVGNLAQCKR